MNSYEFVVFVHNHRRGSGKVKDHETTSLSVGLGYTQKHIYIYIITRRHASLMLGRSKSWEVRSVFAREQPKQTPGFLMHWAACCHCFALHVVPVSWSYTDRDDMLMTPSPLVMQLLEIRSRIFGWKTQAKFRRSFKLSFYHACTYACLFSSLRWAMPSRSSKQFNPPFSLHVPRKYCFYQRSKRENNNNNNTKKKQHTKKNNKKTS